MKPVEPSRFGIFFSGKLEKVLNDLREHGIEWNQDQHFPVDKMIQSIDKRIEENEQWLHLLHPTKRLKLQNINKKLQKIKQRLICAVNDTQMLQVLRHPMPMTVKRVRPTSKNIKRYQLTTHVTNEQSTSQSKQQINQQSSQQSSQHSILQIDQQSNRQTGQQFIRNIQQPFQQLVEIKGKIQQNVSKLKLQNELLNNSVKNIQQEIDRVKQIVHQKEQQIKSIQNEISLCQQKLHTIISNVSQVKQNVSQVKLQVEQLNNLAKNFRQENDRIKQIVQQKEQQIKNVQKQINLCQLKLHTINK